MNGFVEKLKDSGYKLTPQRLAVAQYMDGNTAHPTATAIYSALKPSYPSMSMATIYNTLNVMTRLGLLSELKVLKDQANYDPNTASHHHFCCEKCRSIIDIHGPEIISDYKNYLKDTNHRVDHVSMIFRGVCESCLGG